MKSLNTNWITEGWIDYEYKKYMLLAYLKHVSKNFNSQKLYPFLSDLVYHYQNLVDFSEKKQITTNKFAKHLKKVDLEKFQLEYEKAINDDNFMEEIDIILKFAIPKIKTALNDGKNIYDFVEDNLHIEPIGIMPLTTDFGYMILKNGNKTEHKVFEYEITIFEKYSEQYRSIKTNYITSYKKKLVQSYESIKISLIKNLKTMPNPATYLINSKMQLPLKETFLPIAKRELVRYIERDKA